MRHVILHNHLFKNAGTSVDHILRQNFPGRWVTREFPDPRPDHTPDITGWIRNNPDAVAFSSHTIHTPLPRIDGVRIIPIVMLRDPIDRIASAYRFERTQDADTRGARLARQNDFAGYVHARLDTPGDRQCRNFQTSRLAVLSPHSSNDELSRAKTTATWLSQTGILGLVASFDATMKRLSTLLKPHYPAFGWQPVTANTSGQKNAQPVPPDLRTILENSNRDDYRLLHFAQSVVARSMGGQTSTTISTRAGELTAQRSGI